MQELRRIIRQLILEDKASFMEELLGNPEWDEGASDVAGFRSDQLSNNTSHQSARQRGRLVKQTWSKHVDRGFIDSLVYIHWADAAAIRRRAIRVATGRYTNRDELACGAYISGEVPNSGVIGNVGLLVKGHVTLVANDMNKVFSGSRNDISLANPEMENTSGVNRGVGFANAQTYVLDRQSFYYRRKKGKEAFVDNWEITGIVVSPMYDLDYEKAQKLQKMIKRGGIDVPLIDPGDL